MRLHPDRAVDRAATARRRALRLALSAIGAAIVLVAASGGAPATAATAAAAQPQPIVAAYWQGTPAATGIPPMVNMILYAFASPTGGSCNTPSSTTKTRINSLSALKTANPSLKVIISIGGWGAAGFGADSASAASRQAFVSSCITRWMSAFPAGLVNGFDIDWEFPVYGGLPSIGNSPSDRANLDLLIAEFRSELNAYAAANGLSTSDMLITMPIPAGREQDAGDGVHGGPFDQDTSFDLESLGQTLDYINLETYDLCTGYSTVSCYNDPLVQEAGDPNDQYNNTVGAIQYMEAHGIPATKMLLGFPFYGRYFNVTSSDNGGLYQPWTSSTTVNYSTLVGSTYLTNPAYVMGWDPTVASPYLWKPSTKTWVSYENPQSLGIKSQYAKTAGLAGTFMWQLGADDNSHSLLRAMARPWTAITPAAGAPPQVTGTDISVYSSQAPFQFSGTVAQVVDPDTPATGETAVVNWGDSTASAATVSADGTVYAVNGTHAYASPGTYTLTVTVGDGDPINLVSGNATASVVVDTTAPTTTASLAPASPTGQNGWYIGPVQVTLSASDDAAGVAGTQYAIDGGAWTPYAGPFTVSAEGSHTVQFASTDNAGNAEAPKSISFAVDTTDPVTTAALSPAPHNGWYPSPTLTLTGADGAGSGVAQTDYSLDGGPWTAYASALSGFSTGNHFAQYRSTDLAGRVETTRLIAFKVDAVAPSVNVVHPSEGESIRLGKTETATYKCNDNESGVASCTGSAPDGALLDTSTAGPHVFTVTGIDEAGNQTVVTHTYQVVPR